ncbi:hypothetical protein F5890DRAFT_423051 [Lentinula detonsa]|uniref:Transmembrane protein n=1 Tax=Lentinula detonsa TaxID=2804962 RepID=A0AA38PUN0_9AGAR|nr:hypothetical protein F5890DRAFT_423051 [Lentinula detonsa]
MSNSSEVTFKSNIKFNEPSSPWLIGIASITAAMAVPAALYLRRKHNIKLPTRPIVPRRQTTVGTPLKSLTPIQSTALYSNVAQGTSGINSVNQSPLNHVSHSSSPEVIGKNDFNPALYTIGAFGIATLLVSLGALIGVGAVKTTMNVQDTQEFAREMRRIVVTRMPILSARIHRALNNGDDDDGPEDTIDWNWEDAEKRLKDAFEKDGLMAWAEVALKEIQAEERLERSKRKGLDDAH